MRKYLEKVLHLEITGNNYNIIIKLWKYGKTLDHVVIFFGNVSMCF